MRVNIIGNLSKGTGVSQDIRILHGMIAHVVGETTQIRHVPHFFPHCPEADVNFFVEVINPALFIYAGRNVWIPNPEWTYKTWEPYAKMVDEIWVKTNEAALMFSEWTPKVRFIGWTSIDKVFEEKKNYSKAIVPSGKNVWRNPKPIIQAYIRIATLVPALFTRLPELHVVWHDRLPPIPENIASKVIVHSGFMDEKEYDELLHECGLAICMSATEGFGHAVNEAMSAGCIPMLSPISPFLQLTSNAFWVSNDKVTPHPTCMGSLEDIQVASLVDALREYVNTDFNTKKEMTFKVRKEYESRHERFLSTMSIVLNQEVPTYSLEGMLPKEDDLPKVSIITVTRDRRAFMPLAKYCFLAQSYPADKLEWVIVDDGKDQIKDMVSDLENVKYILLDEPHTIGQKRNIGIEAASHDVLVMMDDDDVYPNNSVLSRVAHMFGKECLFSCTIPCYHIHDKKSFMNVPPMTLPLAERVSEATLCFTRAFWEGGKFLDIQIGEGNAFIRGREGMCREFSPEDVIVSLAHKSNTSGRKAPEGPSNGCHYGFSDELFTLVSEIGESL
jgi:hypothetical protein